jgi:uncharacterized protein (TIGR00288 family)
MENRNVGLLIDWENIRITASENLKSPPDIITLKKIARRYGKIAVARAYANWTDINHEGDMERFSLQEIEPVFVQTKRFKNIDQDKDVIKGSADIKLACDCIELIFKNPSIDTYVLASGDGGFEHIISKLKTYAKQTIPIGVMGATSSRLGVVSDELIIYDQWLAGIRMGHKDIRVSEAITEFVRAVEDVVHNQKNNSLQAIKAQMKKKNLDFEEEELGFPSFRHLAYLAEIEGKVRIDCISEPAKAYLPNTTKTGENLVLHSCDKWKKLIEALKPHIAYNRSLLQDIIKNNEIYENIDQVSEFLNNAIQSTVLWKQWQQYFDRRKEKVIRNFQYYLNLNHPKVQVVLNIPKDKEANHK